MVIKFICPNGHQLSAPDERAGKPGKCPKCETAFVVPDLEDEDLEDEDPEDEDDESEGEDDADEESANPDMIVFLCPNGHRLNGPAKLKGRPGQCPHCGSKFRIPDDDDDEEEEEIPTGTMVDEELGSGEFAELEDVEIVEDDGEVVDVLDVVDEFLLGGQEAPLAGILERICGDHTGLRLEIKLGRGDTITVDQFSSALSRYGHAVFAVEEEDGSQTVTAVLWDDIVGVRVCDLPELPEGLF